ncbi:Synaptic vesicle glycoprotein 2B [Trichoplax sp. H2]|nr:Synaptic vesicle glycoprotein 2B [Trichoplax sp. H2]|eukprot:RDD37984.1 Synaptic vesicle glycoprotein 2B [Trichoplax sp. H2]
MVTEKSLLSSDDNDEKTVLMDQHEELYSSDYSTDSIDLTSKIDEIVDAFDIRLFHYVITIVCGLGYGGYSLLFQSLGFIVVAACDLDINRNNKGWVGLTFMIGITVGFGIFGKLADTYGRRKILVLCLLINWISILGCVFAYNYVMFVIMTGAFSLGCAGVSTTVYPYVTEFFPRRHRGRAGAVLSTFITLGTTVGSIIALVVLPRSFYIPMGAIYFTSWRLYLLIGTIPTLLSLCILLCMPNSLRFVLANNDRKGIRNVLNKINQINSCFNSASDSYYQEIHFQLNHLDVRLNNIYDNVRNDSYKDFMDNIRKLMKQPWRKRLLILIIMWFGYCFTEQGFILWVPTVTAYYVSGKTCWHHHASKDNHLSWNATHFMNSTNFDCQSGESLKSVVLNVLIGNLLSIPTAILCFLLINRVGRKALYIVLVSISGLSIIMMLIFDNTQSVMILACIFTSITVNGWTPCKIWTTELFRTEFRSTAAGIVGFIGYFGGILGMIIFSSLFYSNCIATFTIFSSFCLLSAFVALFLPDTTNADIG